MKIISYNVNGIRAAVTKGLIEWIEQTKPDILCFQEVKALEDQIDIDAFKTLGYYCFWHPAQKKGYSGVGILSKIKPKHIEVGCSIPAIDNEGRILRADFNDFSVISLYLPSGTNIDRLDYKMQFCYDFEKHIIELKKKIPHLVVCGDYNICHEAIDIHDPVRNANVSGFLPIEREWMGNFIKNCEMIDAFRYLVKEPHHYSWWSYRANARANNKGWRIDYTMTSQALKKYIQRAYILPQAKHSDHCPVVIELDLQF